MKTTAKYFFNSKQEMNEWLDATMDMHIEQAESENDFDFTLFIHNESEGVDCYYAEATSYFPDVDGKNWGKNDNYIVII